MSMRLIRQFALLFLVWLLLVWPFESRTWAVHFWDAAVGLIIVAFTVWFMRDVVPVEHEAVFCPVRFFWLIAYTGVLIYTVVKANFDVAYRVLHPAMPILPGIVRVKTQLKTSTAITALSNSLTLTPGLLTMRANESGEMYVHCINVKSVAEADETVRKVVARYEWFLKRAFE